MHISFVRRLGLPVTAPAVDPLAAPRHAHRPDRHHPALGRHLRGPRCTRLGAVAQQLLETRTLTRFTISSLVVGINRVHSIAV